MTYNNKDYWSKRDNPVSSTLTKPIINFIKEETKDAKTILDFGAGRGRLFQYYPNTSHVTAYDITDRHTMHFVTDHLAAFEFTTRLMSSIFVFDVVVCSEVLLHIKPKEIKDLLRQLYAYGIKIVVITYWEEEDKPLAEHNFKHDYKAILEELNITPKRWEHHGNQLLFTF